MDCICTQELWRPVVGYEGRYLVSDQGRVLSIGGRILKPNLVKKYASVALWHATGFKRCNIHRLVAAAFLGPSQLEVNHINGEHSDNRLVNLEYVTRAENWKHAIRIGRSTKGTRCASAKLNEMQVVEIKRALAEGVSQKALAKKYGVCQSNIYCINARKTWAHVHLV